MSFLSRFFNWGRAGQRSDGYQKGSAGESGSSSGKAVNEDSAMSLSAVYASVRLIAESIGGLPMRGYKLSSGSPRTASPDHPLAILFAGKPNRHQTAVEFWETMGSQHAMHGNAYALIDRTGKRITSLTPLMADQMKVRLLDSSIIYEYYESGKVTVLSEASVFHVKGMGNGIVGLSPLSYAAHAIGIALAADDRAGNIAKRGFKPAGVLMIDKLLTPEQRKAIRAEFAGLAEGDGDPLKVLEAGMTYQQVSMSPADAQFLETRRYQLEDIARFFGVPPILIGDMSASTVWGSGITEIVQGFYKFNLRPYLERFEAAVNNRLLTVEERGRFEFEFDLDSLLRMSPDKTTTRIKEQVLAGLMTPNEGRIEQGLPRMDNPAADRLYMQAQLTPIELLGAQVAKPAPAFSG